MSSYLPLLIVSSVFLIIDLIGVTEIVDGMFGKTLSLIEYSIRPRYLFFFSIGLIARHGVFDFIYCKKKTIFTVLMLMVISVGFFFQNHILENIVEYIFSISLFIDIIQYKDKAVKNTVAKSLLIFMGENSFAIYLWHIIGKTIGLIITDNHYDLAYYGICFTWMVLLCIVIRNFRYNWFYKKLIGAC